MEITAASRTNWNENNLRQNDANVTSGTQVGQTICKMAVRRAKRRNVRDRAQSLVRPTRLVARPFHASRSAETGWPTGIVMTMSLKLYGVIQRPREFQTKTENLHSDRHFKLKGALSN